MADLESRNPVLRERTWDQGQGRAIAGTETMTLNGAINKTGILLVILALTSAYAWDAQTPALGMIGGIAGFICALVLSFNPTMAPWLAPVYAGLEGLLVGTISVMAEAAYPGVPGNAVALTFATLAVMLFCYRVGLLRATPMFRRVVIFTTMAIMVTYLVEMVLMLFHVSMPLINDAKPIGIVFSLIVTAVAAMNLVLDFDLFERNSARSPKYMEWYCGFALLVTLVWLYLEMVRLLGKLNRR